MRKDMLMEEGVGNILFYTSTGDFLGWLISWWTHSPYVHVAIQVSSHLQIEASEKGIVSRPLNGWQPTAVFNYQAETMDLDEKDMAGALAWLEKKIGTPYGYADFLMNAVFFIKRDYYLVKSRTYDCSALATEFLIKAGGVDLLGLEEDPHSVTPGDLAQVLQPKGVMS